MIMPIEYNMEMVRGDTLSFDIIVDEDIGTVTDIAMAVRRFSWSDALFRVDFTDGITSITDGWRVRIPPSATSDAEPGSYRYDVQFTIGDDVYTPLRGNFEILDDATR
jgi:hypothetical protein